MAVNPTLIDFTVALWSFELLFTYRGGASANVLGRFIFATCVFLSSLALVWPAAAEGLDRYRLPIPQREAERIVEAQPERIPFSEPWSEDPPDGAPDVLTVLLNDVGFGTSSPFGGPGNLSTLL